VQNLHEIGGAELGGSTRGLDLLRQPDCFIFTELHRKSTLIVLVVHFNARLFSSRFNVDGTPFSLNFKR
jgi:hypothetical protein